MGVASKYNKGNRYTFQIPENFEFKDMEDLYLENGAERLYNLKGFFINTKSEYGDAPVAITGECFVQLPKHTLKVVKEMNDDDEFVAAVNEGKVGFKIYSYYPKDFPNKMCYSPEWVDL